MRHQNHISKGIFLERRFNEIESILRKDHGSQFQRFTYAISVTLNFWNSPFCGTNVAEWGASGRMFPLPPLLGFPRWPKPKAKYTGTVQSCPDFLCVAPSVSLSPAPSDPARGIDASQTLYQAILPQKSSSGRILYSGKLFSSIFVGQTNLEAPFLQTDSVGGYHHRFTGADSHHGRYLAEYSISSHLILK